MARGVRKQEGEDFSPAVLDKVIELFAQEKPITKKAACEMLHMTYNTTRLNKILEEYKERKIHDKAMRKKMRNVPIDVGTASLIVSGYLSGSSLADISASTYRSTGVIKRVLTQYNVPIRNRSVDYFNPTFIDDNALSTDYKVGDLVYAARYDAPATIKTAEDTAAHGMVYGLWIHSLSRNAAQPWYELADLRRVQNELKIKMYDMPAEEVKQLIAEGLINQKKQADKRK